MVKEVPYYTFDENNESEQKPVTNEAYIDDDDLKELLLDFLSDEVSMDEIEKILDAASDKNITDEDFDKLVDEFILKNKK